MTESQRQMPVKVKPYEHQVKAFDFACGLFGLAEGGDANTVSAGCSYLMEMG